MRTSDGSGPRAPDWHRGAARGERGVQVIDDLGEPIGNPEDQRCHHDQDHQPVSGR